MENNMLPAPAIGASANHVQSHCRQCIDPAMVRIGLVPAVVLNVESYCRGEAAEENRQRNCLRPSSHFENQQHVCAHETRQNDCGLKIHWETIALPKSFRA